mmetsp:Transcript_10806/g.22880  ORF Transcript_10806/g.22880 Transcript_10806/m.22880 type:complete len:122 (+) Transcript_10806:1672-2037(+)
MLVRKAHRPVVFSNPNQVPPDCSSRGASISKPPSSRFDGHQAVVLVGRAKNSSRLWHTKNRSSVHSKKAMHMMFFLQRGSDSTTTQMRDRFMETMRECVFLSSWQGMGMPVIMLMLWFTLR